MSEETFNWVKERYSCTAEKLFDKLRLDVKADVETRQALRKEIQGFGFQYGFSFVSNGSTFSATLRQRNGDARVAAFKLQKGRIIVLDENDKQFLSATATLDKNRQCKFMVGDDELEDWQFRQRALEAVFFGEFDE